ncbi:MAG TPA: hypothetical protein PKY19_04925 [Oscillospiraceae bacterium]|nr:hypothetical protein [Oscillospiraceae bacterium]HXK77809.1 hypothetical protein [Oscillospiraceae bacterium]
MSMPIKWAFPSVPETARAKIFLRDSYLLISIVKENREPQEKSVPGFSCFLSAATPIFGIVYGKISGFVIDFADAYRKKSLEAAAERQLSLLMHVRTLPALRRNQMGNPDKIVGIPRETCCIWLGNVIV